MSSLPHLKRDNYIFISNLLIGSAKTSLEEVLHRVNENTYFNFRIAIKRQQQARECYLGPPLWKYDESMPNAMAFILDHLNFEEIEIIVSQLSERAFSIAKHIFVDLPDTVHNLLPKKEEKL